LVGDPQYRGVNVSKPVSLPRTVRGARPEFFETPGMDAALSMIVTLAQELMVLRERLDSAERVLAKHNIDVAAEIEALELDEEQLTAREKARQAFFDRLFFIQKQRRAELEENQTFESYLETIQKVARGDI